MNQIFLSKDAQGNVTVLTPVPAGLVDAQGKPVPQAYRSKIIKASDIENQLKTAQANTADLQAQATAINALPAPQATP